MNKNKFPIYDFAKTPGATESEVLTVQIIRGFSDPAVDPVETDKKVAQIRHSFPNAPLEKLYADNAVYSDPGFDTRALEEAFLSLGENETLTADGEVIPDFRGVEYWEKTSGRWEKLKIELADVPLPAGAVLPDDLTPEQRQEIGAQQEADRIATLTPEQRDAELEARLDALADEASQLEKRAQIQGKPFDAAAWYQEKSPEITAKYAAAV
jgi:hypothetical protein